MKEKRRPGAKPRLRGKSQGVTEAKPAKKNAIPTKGIETQESKERTRPETGAETDEVVQVGEPGRGWAKLRKQVVDGGNDRPDDGVKQGVPWTKAPARQDKNKGARQGGKEDEDLYEEQEEDRGEDQGDEEEEQKGREDGGEGGRARPSTGEHDPKKGFQPVPMERAEIELSQRKSLPILTDLRVSQTNEQKKLNVLPGLACSTCTIGQECPEYKEGFVCAFKDAFDAFPSRDLESVLSLMVETVDTNKRRLRFAQLNERISGGGMIDPNVTRLSEVVMSQARGLVELHQEQQKVTVRVEKVGTVTPSNPEAPQQIGGVLSRLFSMGSSAPLAPAAPPVAPPVDAVVVEMNPSGEGSEDSRTNDPRGVTIGQVEGERRGGEEDTAG